jgi:hypothetical protein
MHKMDAQKRQLGKKGEEISARARIEATICCSLLVGLPINNTQRQLPMGNGRMGEMWGVGRD